LRVLLLLLALTSSLLVACSRQSPTLVCQLPFNGVVLAAGDSLTRGYGAEGNGYVEQLQERLQGDGIHSDVQVLNRGQNGEKSGELLQRLPELMAQTQPDVVVLTSGGNDFLRRVQAAETAANLNSIIDLVNHHGAMPVIFAVPEPGLGAIAGLMSDHPVYATLAERGDLVVIGEVVAQAISDDATRSDRIHPNALGYSHMATSAFEVLSQCQ